MTLKNEGNQNNEIGLPLTVLRLRPDHQAAVLEMGMYVGGEIADLARIGRPEIGVVTAVQPVHLSRIGTIEAVEQAKGELVEALPADGVAVLNADDERVRRMASRTDARVVTYGFAPDADVRAEDVESAGADGMRFSLVADGVATAGRDPDARPARRPQRAGRRRGRAGVGHPAGAGRRRRSRRGWSAPHRGALVQAGRRDDRRRFLQRVARLGARGARPAGGHARPAGRGPRRDARARRRRARRATSGSGVAAAAVAELLVVVGAGRGRDRPRRARRRPRRRTRSSRSADRAAALAALEERLRPGDVVLVKASRGDRARPARRRPRVQRLEARAAMTVELIQGLLLAFAIVVILMPPYIRLLRATGFTKQIRGRGPGQPPGQARDADDGRGADHRRRRRPVPAPALAVPRPASTPRWRRSPGVGLLGAFDDYLNAKTGEGIRVRQKLIWQVVFAVAAAFLIQRVYAIDQIAVPFLGPVFIDPAIYVIFAAFAIVAASNGVNITDGLDGLAGGTLVFAFVAFLLVALLNQPDAQPNLAFLCALIIGALLGFLWFNVHPAQIFMGDSGSLSLGATLAVIALITGQILVLPLIGLIFVIETALGHPPGRLLQGHRRQAALPDDADPPPLRAGRLGRGEDHAPVLDRRDPVRAARRDAVPRLDPAGSSERRR